MRKEAVRNRSNTAHIKKVANEDLLNIVLNGTKLTKKVNSEKILILLIAITSHYSKELRTRIVSIVVLNINN